MVSVLHSPSTSDQKLSEIISHPVNPVLSQEPKEYFIFWLHCIASTSLVLYHNLNIHSQQTLYAGFKWSVTAEWRHSASLSNKGVWGKRGGWNGNNRIWQWVRVSVRRITADRVEHHRGCYIFLEINILFWFYRYLYF